MVIRLAPTSTNVAHQQLPQVRDRIDGWPTSFGDGWPTSFGGGVAIGTHESPPPRLKTWATPAVVACFLAMLAGCAHAASLKLAAGVPQLFIDDVLIESSTDLKRTLHQPRKDDAGREPIITSREGATLLAYGSIVRDTRLDRYVMFTQAFPSRQMYRCTSADGLAWGALEPITFAPLIPPLRDRGEERFNIDVFSCIYDADDADHPYKGWLYLANCGNDHEGIYYVRSPDGVTWQRGRQIINAVADLDDPTCRVIHQAGRTVYGPGDVTLFAHDPERDRFLGLFKFFLPGKGGVPPGNNLRSRAYAYFDRLDEPFDTGRIDRVALLPPAAETNGDHPYDEYYASTAWRYGPLWLGGLKIWHGKDDYPHSAAGCAFLKLVVSRDGLNWTKVQFTNDAGVPEVFIPNGPEGGHDARNDGGYISEFSQGPLRVGDELVYYYSASSYGKNAPRDQRLHGGGIFRARLRPDGFVSVDRGTLVTPPLTFDGTDLFCNAVGPVAMDVLAADDRVLASANVTGDSLAHRVTFAGRSLAAVAGGKPVRLRIKVDDPGRLYSFTIR